MAGTVYEIRKVGSRVMGFSYHCGCGGPEMSKADLETQLVLLKDEMQYLERRIQNFDEQNKDSNRIGQETGC